MRMWGQQMGRSKPKRRTMAQKSDVHELYEAAVQNVEEECRFMATTFEMIRGRAPSGFREDFCGTGSAACEWVRQAKTHYAFGVDIDPGVLKWGRKHRMSQLGKGQRQRVSLIRGDVREVDTPPVDIVGAFNFSYWIFRSRDRLRDYFEAAHRNLGPEGVFFLDAYGGYAAFEELEEEMDFDDFTYVWEQAKYNPVNGHMKTHIHFQFPDGSKLKKAFTYRWRLWTLPELEELLIEAGFRNPTVYFEETDEEGDGLGCWFPVEKLEASRAWIVNISAEK